MAGAKHVEAIRDLYRSRYAVSLSFKEAKNLLEGVMQFVYLTEVLPRREASNPELSELSEQSLKSPYTGGAIP